MERPRGVNLIYSAGGDPLCTVYIEQNDCTARFATEGVYERFPFKK